MRGLKPSSFLLLLILEKTFAYDGCESRYSWKCGDICIGRDASCQCGGEVFKMEDGKWCCQDSNCTGKGDFDEDNIYWGESDEEGRRIGADCTGTALNLTQACNQTCNYYEEDEYRWCS